MRGALSGQHEAFSYRADFQQPVGGTDKRTMRGGQVMRSFLLILIFVGLSQLLWAQAPAADAHLEYSVAELRNAIGRWNVATEFLNDDGSVSRMVPAVYEFWWVIPDRVAGGRNEIPALSQASGILFYVRETKREIEMVAVGNDGHLWIMTGPLGGNQRMLQEFKTETGTSRLRFTRFNVAHDRFESRMESTDDGGKTWKPGNHQVFTPVAKS